MAEYGTVLDEEGVGPVVNGSEHLLGVVISMEEDDNCRSLVDRNPNKTVRRCCLK